MASRFTLTWIPFSQLLHALLSDFQFASFFRISHSLLVAFSSFSFFFREHFGVFPFTFGSVFSFSELCEKCEIRKPGRTIFCSENCKITTSRKAFLFISDFAFFDPPIRVLRSYLLSGYRFCAFRTSISNPKSSYVDISRPNRD